MGWDNINDFENQQITAEKYRAYDKYENPRKIEDDYEKPSERVVRYQEGDKKRQEEVVKRHQITDRKRQERGF